MLRVVMSSRLHQLSSLGQSVWIDYLSRDLIESGALAKAVDEDAVVGVTSNPSIFEKALAHGYAYDEQIAARDTDARSVFLELAMRDVATACAHGNDCVALASEHGFAQWAALGRILQGWADAQRGDT